MEKVLGVLKGFLAGFVELVTHPITKVTDAVQKEDIKKGAIKAVILAAVLSLTNVLATIRAIHIGNTKTKWINAYMDALNPMLSLLKMFGIYLLAIVAIALVLFIISKLVKDQKSFPYTLSMTVNSGAVYAVGGVLGLIFCFWTPLSMLFMTLGALHSGITLVVSFMSSLSNVNTDQLVLVTAVVLIIVSIIMVIIHLISHDTKLTDYMDSKFAAKTQYSDITSDAVKKYYKSTDTSDILSSVTSDTVNDLLSNY